MSEAVHATAIAVAGRAALIRGPSSSGKSDLALRCLALAPSALLPIPAMLVADDYVALERRGGTVFVRAPETLTGSIEVRGVGIMRVASLAEAEVALIVDLVDPHAVPRLPDPITRERLLGVELPVLLLAPFEASAAAKLLLALHARFGTAPWDGNA